MPRRKKADNELNLDSLLDTLFNVVGILVLILVMVMLDATSAVKRAVQRLIDVPKISLEELDQKQEVQKQLEELLKQLSVRQDDLAKPAVSTTMDQAQLTVLIEKLKADLAKLPTLKYNLEEVRQVHAERTTQADELTKKLEVAKAELARLKALLDQTPLREAPPDIEVSIPTPRDAPQGLTPRIFLCRGGRIVDYREELLMRLAESNLRKFNSKKLSDTATHLGGYPGDEVAEYFAERKFGKPFFELEVLPYYKTGNPWVYLSVNLVENTGDTADTIAAGDSALEANLKNLPSVQQYALFEVWEDSFDVYVEARKVAERFNVLAGWRPYKMNENWPKRIRLGSEYRFAVERPKPAPPAPPRPAPAPAPAPKPTGPQPPPPLDDSVID